MAVVTAALGRPMDPPAGARGQVVVIEDHPGLRRMIAGLLEEAGFGAREAADGPTGLRAIERVRPDLAVLDLALGGLPGREVLARIRGDAPTAALPVLLVGDPTDGVPVVGTHERLLPKPFSYVEFVEAVESLIPTGLRLALPPW